MNLMQEAARRNSSSLSGGVVPNSADGRPPGQTHVVELCESAP